MKVDRLFESFLDARKDKGTARNRLIFWISILLAGLFLYLALRDLEWDAFFSILSKARIAYLPVFLLWGSLSSLVRAYRWRILLGSEKPVSLLSVFFANMAGYLGNMVLPARAGELVRSAYLGKQTGIPISFAIATGLTERLIDGIALVLLGSLALVGTGLLSPVLERSLGVMGIIGVTGLIGVLLLSRSTNLMGHLVYKLPGLDTDQKEKLDSVIQSFLMGLAALSSVHRAASFASLTVLIWLMDAAGMVFLSQMLSSSLTLLQAVILLAALGLSSAIPSTPGYVGVYQFAAVWALKPFGISNANAVALALSVQVINMLMVGFWGILAVAKFSKSTKEPVSE